jgi:hypothetical protein
MAPQRSHPMQEVMLKNQHLASVGERILWEVNMKGKIVDSIIIRVGHGIMTIPRNSDKATTNKLKKESKESSIWLDNLSTSRLSSASKKLPVDLNKRKMVE